jgi:YHS domain-containing protein
MVKDLVCGMEVDPKSAAAMSEYQGKLYYFCSRGCKASFDKHPERYLETLALDDAPPAGGKH